MKRFTTLFLLAACTTSSPSGFLKNYKDLKPRPDSQSQRAWFKPGIDLRDYNRLMIDPIVVRLNPDSKAGDLGAGAVRRAADDFRRILKETTNPYYSVVTRPGPHVLRVRAAITDLVPVIDGTLGVGGAAMEAELLDPESGERLAAVVDRLTGTEGAEGAFREWASRLLDFMDSHRD